MLLVKRQIGLISHSVLLQKEVWKKVDSFVMAQRYDSLLFSLLVYVMLRSISAVSTE